MCLDRRFLNSGSSCIAGRVKCQRCCATIRVPIPIVPIVFKQLATSVAFTVTFTFLSIPCFEYHLPCFSWLRRVDFPCRPPFPPRAFDPLDDASHFPRRRRLLSKPVTLTLTVSLPRLLSCFPDRALSLLECVETW
jgi:hypothetical protein